MHQVTVAGPQRGSQPPVAAADVDHQPTANAGGFEDFLGGIGVFRRENGTVPFAYRGENSPRRPVNGYRDEFSPAVPWLYGYKLDFRFR